MSDTPKRPHETCGTLSNATAWMQYADALEANRDAWKARAEKAESQSLLPGLREALEIVKGVPAHYEWTRDHYADRIQEAIDAQQPTV